MLLVELVRGLDHISCALADIRSYLAGIDDVLFDIGLVVVPGDFGVSDREENADKASSSSCNSRSY